VVKTIDQLDEQDDALYVMFQEVQKGVSTNGRKLEDFRTATEGSFGTLEISLTNIGLRLEGYEFRFVRLQGESSSLGSRLEKVEGRL